MDQTNTKTVIAIIALMLTAMLLVACSPDAKQQKDDSKDSVPKTDLGNMVDESEPLPPTPTGPEEPAIDKSYDTRRGDYARPAETEPVEEPDEASTSPASERKDLPVSQKELDALKADIEGIQAEDLGGLEK